MANWTLTSAGTTLDNSTAQPRRGTHCALQDNSSDYMYHAVTGLSGAFKATFWIYDGNTQTRSIGEVRAYSSGIPTSGTLQQVLAIGKYNSASLETWDSTKYQGRFLYPSGGWFNLNAAGAPGRSVGWHKFEIERTSSGTVNYYVDGVLGRSYATTVYTMNYALIGMGAGTTAGNAYFDDVLVEDTTGGYLGTINTQPASQTKGIGDTVTFSVSAFDGGTPANLTYQWKKAGAPISGATTSAYSFTVASTSGGAYAVDVMGAFGTNTSGDAVLTVGQPRTWVGLGGDDNWGTAANWDGAFGKAGYAAHFDGFTRLTPNMEDNYSVTALEFEATAQAFTLGAAAGKALTLSGPISQLSPNLQIINLPVTLSGTQAVYATAGDLAINGVISGTSAGLTKSGPNTLTLSATNTYDGPTTISAGTLKLGNPEILPKGSGKGDVTVAGTLDLAGINQTVNGLNGAGVVDSSGGSGLTDVLTVGSNNAAGAFSGSIKNSLGSDKVALTKVGSGIFTLSGNHTYSGDTTLSAGTVSINASTFFGDETGTLRLAGGNILMTASQSSSSFGNAVVMSDNTTFGCSSGISGTWYMCFSSPYLSFTGGTLTLNNGGNQGTTTFLVQFQTMGGIPFTRPIVLSAGSKLELCNDDTMDDAVISGPVTGGGQVNYTSWGAGTGGNTLATNANNTYSGGSQLTGGYIGFGADSTGTPVTAGPIGTGALTINDDPTLGLFASGAAHTIGNAIIFNALHEDHVLFIKGAYDLTFTGTIGLGNSNRTVQVDNTGVTTCSGVISGGAAGKTLTKIGTGTLVFGGNNTYSIPTAINGGTLLVNNTVGSGTGAGAVTVNSGATLGGTGTIAGAVTVSSAAIGASASADRLSLQGGLDLSASGTDQWELAANSTSNPGTNFDQIALTGGNLVLGGSSALMINFVGAATTPDLGTPFWQQPRQWKIISLSGTAANPGNSNFSSIAGVDAITAGTFSTSADATGITLTYTPSITLPAPVTSMRIGPGIGGDYSVTYSGGTGSQFVLVRSANVAAPLSSWTRVDTNTAASGSFTISIGSDPKEFYRIISE